MTFDFAILQMQGVAQPSSALNIGELAGRAERIRLGGRFRQASPTGVACGREVLLLDGEQARAFERCRAIQLVEPFGDAAHLNEQRAESREPHARAFAVIDVRVQTNRDAVGLLALLEKPGSALHAPLIAPDVRGELRIQIRRQHAQGVGEGFQRHSPVARFFGKGGAVLECAGVALPVTAAARTSDAACVK